MAIFSNPLPTYPGTALRVGSTGANVRIIQAYLNAIGQTNPNIPPLVVDGNFGPRTEASVMAFQRQFGLNPDGVVGPLTWAAIMRQYANVIFPPYPGTLQRVGSTGVNVQIIQAYLNVIGRLYSNIPPLVEDGNFGPRTEASVMAFQRQFGLNPDGVVGPITWAAIIRQYAIAIMPPYPAILQRVGSTGASVRLIQEYLNVIGRTHTSIPPLVEDGVFGPRTEASVMAFQRQFGLNPDGIVGPRTWAELMWQYVRAVASPGPGPVVPPVPPPPPPPPPQAKTIVIDAGHGGTDWGAVFGQRREKDDNLRLALAVQRLLQARGQRVIMTRTTDVFLTLAARSTLANQNNADIFVSIHRNSSTNTTANGVENYIFTTAPTVDMLYAFNVLDPIVDAGVQNNRGVIRGNFAVLRNTNAPSMLLEMGFITNARDNQLFDQNFNAYAAAIAQGIMESVNGPQMPPPTYFFYTVTSGDSLASLAQRFGTTQNAIVSLNKLTRILLITGQVLKIPSR